MKKQKLELLAQRYASSLRKHLEQGTGSGFGTALKLGRDSVALGLATLDLARIHERAMGRLKPLTGRKDMTRRAEAFFTEALTPIVDTRRAVRKSKVDLKRLDAALVRRTAELAVANRHLKRGIVRRRSVEAALKKSGDHYGRLLKKSLELQKGLRQLTHRVLAAQEDERRKISHELQDEIAQTLLGINVRLVSLKQEARNNTAGMEDEIASTRRMVATSTKTVRRLARDFGGK